MRTKKITYTGILAAIGIVLAFIEFNVPIFPSFLKFDFSFLPAIIASLLFSPLAGIIISFIINAFHLLQTTTGGIGQLANFIVCTAFILPVGIIYTKNRTKKMAIVGLLISVISMSVVACLANYYILFPFYSKIMPIGRIISMVPGANSLIDVILYAILPFNLIKGFFLSLLIFLIYKKLPKLKTEE